MSTRRCLLCANAGRVQGRMYNQSAICQDCRAMLRAQGRAWCAAGLHVVARLGRNRRCRDCDAREHREARRKRGLVRPPPMSEDERRAAERAKCRRYRERYPERKRAWQQANRERLSDYNRRWRIRRKLAILRGER